MAKKVDERLYVRALKEIIKITGYCPNTLYSIDLGVCAKCEVNHFPRETEREEGCWGKFLKMKLKEEGKGDNKSEKVPQKKENEQGGELPGIGQ